MGQRSTSRGNSTGRPDRCVSAFAGAAAAAAQRRLVRDTILDHGALAGPRARPVVGTGSPSTHALRGARCREDLAPQALSRPPRAPPIADQEILARSRGTTRRYPASRMWTGEWARDPRPPPRRGSIPSTPPTAPRWGDLGAPPLVQGWRFLEVGFISRQAPADPFSTAVAGFLLAPRSPNACGAAARVLPKSRDSPRDTTSTSFPDHDLL